MKTILRLLPIIACLSAPGLVMAKHHEAPLKEVLSQLDLSVQQRNDMRTLMKQSREQARIYKQDVKNIQGQIQEQIQAPQFDKATVQSLIEQRQKLQSEVALLNAQNRHQMWQQLSTEQQQKFNQLMESKGNDRTKQADRQRNPMRMLAALDLSDEQESQFQQWLAEEKPKNQALHQQLKAFKRAEKELIQQSEFDPQAWQAIDQQQKSVQAQLALNHSETRNRIWNALSETQQQKLQKLTHKRMEKWRKRGEEQEEAM